MKNRIFFVLLCLIGMSMYSVPAFSWGQEGHRVIAKIAYDNLTPKARKSVDKILGKRGMIYWSNWADEIKSDNIYPQSIKDGWHYQNLESGLSDSGFMPVTGITRCALSCTSPVISIARCIWGGKKTWAAI